MNKPYNTEIIKLMAEHSDECAAYASAMKWDFWRRQKIVDTKLTQFDIARDCAFCNRYDDEVCDSADSKCLLKRKAGGKYCTKNKLYLAIIAALEAKDQQAYTENANNLYFQIRSIIDDFYKPEPKKEEVFYHTGQHFSRAENEYVLSEVSMREVMMINNSGTGLWATKAEVKDPKKITEKEFTKICGGRDFTLIEDKK